MEDVNKQRLKFFSPSELEYGSEEFGSKSVRLHLTKYTSWSNRDRGSKNAKILLRDLFVAVAVVVSYYGP